MRSTLNFARLALTTREQLCWHKMIELWREWFFGGVKFPPAITPHYQLKANTCTLNECRNTNTYKAVYMYTFYAKLIFIPCDFIRTKIAQLKIVVVWTGPLRTQQKTVLQWTILLHKCCTVKYNKNIRNLLHLPAKLKK